ncbi:hypothetical protein KJ877_01750 [bacterium]|nr:hypothetical protein [bacterium]MBU1990895.1 hypothetical protein [bacterium]
MKPLLAKELDNFLERFDYFKDGEFRSIDINSATSILITLSAQDKARAFDWVSIDLEFSGVSDARLLDNSKLSHVDMNEGISILFQDKNFYFGIGECSSLNSIKSSTCQITSSSLKYKEGLF